MAGDSVFETVGDAVQFCEEHGLKKSAGADDLFETAESLYRAVDSGRQIVINSFNEQAREMGGFCVIEAQPCGKLPLFRLLPPGVKLKPLQ